MGYFQDNYEKIQFTKGLVNNNGLRNAQLGAIHALGSYFTLDKNKAAIVVMPTGSGKTAVLMMTPYLLCAKRVLVVTPSKMVRGQIYEEFCELKTLINANALPVLIHKPNVFEMNHLYSDEENKKYNEADVIVATPQCALSLVENKAESEKFDCVLIDEAHHTPAASWTRILELTQKVNQVLFTATPFRMDSREIKGEVIYRYPLKLAYRDGIFGEIMYIPISASAEKDLRIAYKAEEILMQDREKGYEHFLMVRTNTKEKAKDLEKLYAEKTTLRLKRIDSSMSNNTVKKCIEALKNKELDGIICVDMLGEGFDFPNLKIAAIHEVHKSLANTLQFIGRFARTNASNIGTAKFITINDEELLIENRRLYGTDAVWQDIFIDISDGKVDEEIESKEYIASYHKRDKSASDVENFSLYNIRPGCHAKIYRVNDFNISSSFPNGCGITEPPYVNTEDNTIVGIGKKLVPPKWLASNEINDVEHLLYIVHYQVKTGLLFILSQIKTETLYDEIASAFSSGYEKIPKSKMHRVLAELKNFEIFNSGMANRFSESGESYRISAGSDTSQAINESTGKMYSAGHAFCKAMKDGNEIIIGYSSASKMWSSGYALLNEYIKWCDYNGEKIANDEINVKTNTNFDFLPIPRKLISYPQNLFFANFSSETYLMSPLLYYKEEKEPIGNLIDSDIKIINIIESEIKVAISIGNIEETYVCDIEGHYEADTSSKLTVSLHNERVELDKYFCSYPLQYKATDDTVIDGAEILFGNTEVITYDSSNIVAIDWINKYGTDVTIEFNDKKHHPTGKSIQTTLKEILEDEQEAKYIIYDHGSGEIADFITGR